MPERRNSGPSFEELVGKILSAYGFDLDNVSLVSDRGFDFQGTYGGQVWAIEVKYYRTSRSQLALIGNAASQLASAVAPDAGVGRAMLVVSSYIDPNTREALEEQHKGVLFADRYDLRQMASTRPDLLIELDSLLEETSRTVGNDPRHGSVGIRERAESAEKPRRVELDKKGEDLCGRLRGLKPGKVDGRWKIYEDLCLEIIEYLFADALPERKTQKRTDDGLNRFDLICRLSPASQFWEFISDHLNTRYVLFEFKNYLGNIKQGQILTTEKYLLSQALRNVAIILTRKGADKGAKTMIAGAMRDVGKLMIVLDDDQVCEMLHAKQRGDDPTDMLFSLTDDFLMSLNR